MNDAPFDESVRLRALHDLEILDTEEEEAFDRIARVASAIYDVPIALISIVDRDRQWHKSRVGMDERELPREESFCAHALGRPDPLVVEDARSDERFRDNPRVIGAPGIRFYAGAQVRTRDGLDLGTLCVVDTEPRKAPGRDELEILQALADTASLLIEQRRLVLRYAHEADRRRAAEIAASQARDQAQAASDTMRAFFSKISHDLRTPLGSIIGFAEFLREEDLAEEQKQDVEEIYKAGKNLLRLVDELLEEGRIRSEV